MNDDQLKAMLQTWQAPRAPETLRQRVFAPKPFSLRWLLAGDIRIPVPLAFAALCGIIFVAYHATRPHEASLSGFQPVQQFQPRIVRSIYETR